MTTSPTLDPALLDRLSRQCATLARDFDRFGADLYALTTAVEQATVAEPASAPAPVPPPAAPVAPAAPATRAAPAQAPVLPASTPVPTPVPVHNVAIGQLRAPASEPWWQRDGWISRVLALAGVAVTLVGVVMLLVLAARAGLLRPEARVAMGAVLAAALAYGGVRVNRRPGGRVGGVALVATGVAAAYLDIVAMTSIYHWVHPTVGLGFAALVTGAGVATAIRWRSPHLAVVVNVACALTAPVLTHGLTLTLVLFFIVFQLAGAVPELLRGWSVLAPVRTAPVLIALLLVVVRDTHAISFSGNAIAPAPRHLALALTCAVIGLGVGIWGARIQRRPEIAALTAGMATTALLYVTELSHRPTSLILGFSIALATWALLVLVRRDAAPIRVVLASVGGLALLIGCLAIPTKDPVLDAVPLLAVAVVAAALTTRVRSRIISAYAAAYGLIGTLVTLDRIGPQALSHKEVAQHILSWNSIVVGVLLLTFTLLTALGARQLGVVQRAALPVIATGLVLGLYAVTIVCVSVPVAVGAGDTGFHVGHFAATTAWMLTGCAALALGLARPAYAKVLLATGLTTIAIALLKLVTYDAAALDGFTRAATFLVAGLLLLVAGTRYARAFAERDTAPAVQV
ncbi:MAG: DUF2339 domain-containing protein [Nostocoides sp.]